jgi:hypothetical protein
MSGERRNRSNACHLTPSYCPINEMRLKSAISMLNIASFDALSRGLCLKGSAPD